MSFDEEKYKEIIRVCALEQDLITLSAGGFFFFFNNLVFFF
jgi:hypothetical protein